MQNLVNRLLSFDRLLGVGLVQIIYYFGLVCICGGILIGLLFALMRLMADPGAGLMMMLAIPAVGAVVLMLWRFICEVFVVAFEMNERLGDLRNAVYGAPAAPPGPDAPHF